MEAEVITGLMKTFFSCGYAYIDPGSGSLALQFVIGGVLAGLYFLRSFFARLWTSFLNLFRPGKRNK